MQYKYDSDNISDYLKLLRTNHHLSTYKLADLIGLSRTTIIRLESGINIPSTKTLRKYSDYFKEEIVI